MPIYLTVSEAARTLETRCGVTVRPRDLSTLLYQRELPDGVFPLMGGRRMIPVEHLPQVEAALRRKGLIEPGAPMPVEVAR